MEPFFGTGGANSSISERASSDFDPEICGEKQNSNVETFCSNNNGHPGKITRANVPVAARQLVVNRIHCVT